MARVRRNWTPKEDELLRRAVRTAEAQQRPLLWRELAKAVPGRSNKDCRRRWWNSLADGNAKGPWAEEEDERLIAAVQKYGTNWTRVAQEVRSRGSDQCSSHWSHVLDPNINYCDWTEEEDADLLHEVLTYGTKWAHIASCHNPSRTTLALKNRYSTLRLKNDNRNKYRPASCERDYHGSSTGNTGLPTPHIRSSEQRRTPNPSESSESAHAADEDIDDDEDGAMGEAEIINAWLDDPRHANDGTGNHHQQQHHQQPHHHQLRPEDDPGSLRLGSMHIQVPDAATLSSWDAWTKFGLPTPHHAPAANLRMSAPEAVGMDVESYMQLGSPMIIHRSSMQEPSPLPETCFYQSEADSLPTADQSAAYASHDNTRCRQQTPVSTSPTTMVPSTTALGSTVDIPLEPQTTSATQQIPPPPPPPSAAISAAAAAAAAATSTSPVTTTAATLGSTIITSHANGWSMGPPSSAASCSSPPPSWPQPSPASSFLSLGHGPLSKFRVSITTTCDQEQLMNIITQLSQYGTAPSINVQKE